MRLHALYLLVICGLIVSPIQAQAEPPRIKRPVISLIMDDLGEQIDNTRRTIRLPGRINCSFLPYGTETARLAQQAHLNGKEVMLHLPMEPHDHPSPLGEVSLTRSMDRAAIIRTLRRGMKQVPHARGINNHMGSLVTEQPDSMAALMQAVYQQGIFFIDSRTSARSIAARTATQYGIPNATRDIFLDHVRAPDAIAKQFERLLQIASRRGNAIAIAHPYPETLDFLEQALPQLEARGFELLPVSELLTRQLYRQYISPLLLTERAPLSKKDHIHLD